MSHRAALIAVAALALTLVGGCGPTPPIAPSSPPPVGLSQARALEAAATLAGPHQGSLSVEDVRSGTFAELGRGVSLRGVASDDWVWLVTFKGEFAASCASPSPAVVTGSASGSCGSPTLTHNTVVIDYRDGHLLLSSLGP